LNYQDSNDLRIKNDPQQNTFSKIRKETKMKQVNRPMVPTPVIMAWILFFALISLPVYAEENKSDNEGNAASNMEILREKIQADKKLLVAANLDLTETEAKAFWPVYDEFQTKLIQNNERVAKIIMEYSENYDIMTAETAQKLLNESLMIEEQRLELKQLYLPKFHTALPAIKVARYYQIENKIQAILQYELADGIPLMK